MTCPHCYWPLSLYCCTQGRVIITQRAEANLALDRFRGQLEPDEVTALLELTGDTERPSLFARPQ